MAAIEDVLMHSMNAALRYAQNFTVKSGKKQGLRAGAAT
ncbi:hypothetical protein L581_0228 [Serratia fonticola AU-AP2C]|nr:hypothetical protein L581_0228 [Serratia fonticola AU-AP2C]